MNRFAAPGRLARLGIPVLRWYGRRLAGASSPLIVNLCLTRHCNFRCAHCYVPHEDSAGNMPWALYTGILRQLRSLRTAYLYLSGGEPLLLPDLEERIRLAKQVVPYVHLVTNGFLLDSSRAISLARAGVDLVSLSLDGDPATHDAVRNQPGAYRRVLNALALLSRQNPPVTCQIVTQAAPWNVDQLEYLARLTDGLAFELRITAHVAYPRLADPERARHWRETITEASIERLQQVLDRFQAHYGRPYDPFLRLMPGYYRRLRDGSDFGDELFTRPCPVPLFYVNILEDGEVFACPGMKSSLYPGTGTDYGSFSCARQSLADVFASEAYRSMQRALRDCAACRDYLASCYVRPRLHFPLGNLIRYRLVPTWTRRGRGLSRPDGCGD